MIRAFGSSSSTLTTDQSSTITDYFLYSTASNPGGTYVGDGGGNGGAGGRFADGGTANTSQVASGGGGAGGYGGNGGQGGSAWGQGLNSSTAGIATTSLGGGGGGGATGYGTIIASGGAGGGSSVIPITISTGFAGSVANSSAVPTGGTSGSGGGAGNDGSTSTNTVVSVGGLYGGGGGGVVNSSTGSIGAGAGSDGAVRIMWSSTKIVDGSIVRSYSSSTNSLTLVSDQSGTISDTLVAYQYILTVPSSNLSSLNYSSTWTTQLWDPTIFPRLNVSPTGNARNARERLYYTYVAQGKNSYKSFGFGQNFAGETTRNTNFKVTQLQKRIEIVKSFKQDTLVYNPMVLSPFNKKYFLYNNNITNIGATDTAMNTTYTVVTGYSITSTLATLPYNVISVPLKVNDYIRIVDSVSNYSTITSLFAVNNSGTSSVVVPYADIANLPLPATNWTFQRWIPDYQTLSQTNTALPTLLGLPRARYATSLMSQRSTNKSFGFTNQYLAATPTPINTFKLAQVQKRLEIIKSPISINRFIMLSLSKTKNSDFKGTSKVFDDIDFQQKVVVQFWN